MAKYTIDYACGHGSFTEDLVGKGSERDRKIAWLESNKLCLTCYKAKMQEQKSKEKLLAEFTYNPHSRGVWLVINSGDTYAIKDSLKKIGCIFKEWHNKNDLFGANNTKKAWGIYVGESPKIENFGEILQKKIDLLASLNIGIKALDLSPWAQVGYIAAAEASSPINQQ